MKAAGGFTQALLGVPQPAAAAALRLHWQQMSWAARGGWALLVLLFVGLAAGIAWLVDRRYSPAVLYGGVLAVALLAWGGQVAGLLEQNHPQMARLVPGHLRALRRLAVALWAAFALVLGTLGWLALGGHFGFADSVILVGLAAAALAWCARWPLLWFAFAFVPGLWPLVSGGSSLYAAWLQAVNLWRSQAPLSTVVVLALLACSVAAVFGRGDARHARAYARQGAWRAVGRRDVEGAKGRGPAAVASPLDWIAWPLAAIGNAWLARLLRQASPGRRSVMARAGIVLHGCHHALWHLMGVGAVLLVLALVVAAVLLTVVPEPARIPMNTVWWKGHPGIAVGLASLGLNVLSLLPRALWASRREQALLVLLPGMPRGRALSAEVARLQLRHLGVAWAVTAAVALALYGVAGTALALCMALVALPVLLAWLLRPPAGRGEVSKLREMLPMATCLIGGSLLLTLLGGWRQAPAPAALAAVAAVSVAASLVLGLRGWRQLLAAPPALPAGRLS